MGAPLESACFRSLLPQYQDKSLAGLDQAIELAPLNFAALTGKARISMMQGRLALGPALLRRAVEIYSWLEEPSPMIELPMKKPAGILL